MVKMEIYLPENSCFNCSRIVAKLLLCEGCLTVGFCSSLCKNKHLRKHRKECFQIQKLKNNSKKEAEKEIIELITGFDKLDMSLEYKYDGQFKSWLDQKYQTSYFLSRTLERLSEKRLHKLLVEQLLHWKLMEQKCFYLIQRHENLSEMNVTARMILEEYLKPMNCLIALGNYQTALDYITHWRMRELLKENERVEGLLTHYKAWVDGQYDSELLTDDIDLFRFVTTDGNDEKELTLCFNLIIIKLHVVAVIKEHLSKRERFLTFMQGTHSRLGEYSDVRRITCVIPVIKIIANYCGVTKASLGVSSTRITGACLAQNKDNLADLMVKVQTLNQHALFSMTGDYSLRKLDFLSEDDFLAKPAVQTSWSAGCWSRLLLENLNESERNMFVQMAREAINHSTQTIL